MVDMRSRLMKGALWIAIGRLVANTLGLISTLILARILVPEDFGLVAISTAFMAILTSVTDMPVSEALIQHKDPKKDHFHTAFTISTIRGAIIGLVLVFCAGPVAQFYGDERLRGILQVLAIGVFVLSLSNPRLILFQRELVFHQIFIMQISEKLVGFATAVAIAMIYQSYWALIVGAISSELTRVLLSYVLRPFFPRFTLVYWRDLLSFSIWLTLNNCAQALNWRINPLVFGALLPTNTVGQFSFGQRMTGILFGQLEQPVRQTLYPAFSQMSGDKERLKAAYLRAQALICLCVFPMSSCLIALAPILVFAAVGEKWMLAVPVIQIQSIISTFQIVVALDPVAMATNNTKSLFFRSLRSLVIRWPIVAIAIWLSWPLGPDTVLVWAMIGSLLAGVINTIWNMTLVTRIADVSLRSQIGIAIRPFLAAIACACAIQATQYLLPLETSMISLFAQLIALGLIGLTTYAYVLVIAWRFAGRPNSAEIEIVAIVRLKIQRFFPRSRN